MNDYSERLKALTSEPSRDVVGDPSRLARVGRTRDEMMAQGTAIAKTLAAEADKIARIAVRLRERGIRHVVVAGCGDSWHVGTAAAFAWESLAGIPLRAVQALDYANYGALAADQHTLVIGISSGGTTPAVLEALRAARRGGAFTLGVSNTPGSVVLSENDASLVVHASRKGWPTQSSIATTAMLIRLAQFFSDTDKAKSSSTELDAIPALVDNLASALDRQMSLIARDMAASGLVLFAGLGPNYAAACFGAAKVKELSPIHAVALPLEEYHHYRSQKAGDTLVLVATDAASHERALDTMLVSEKLGGWTVVMVAENLPEITSRAQHTVRVPPVSRELLALISSIPLHLLAYHFAIERDAIGLGYVGGLPAH